MQRVLIKVYRASMKNSLEVRVPFLDKQVLEEAWKTFFLIDDLENLKKPLKELVGEVLPKELLMNKKKGFGVPIELWMRHQLKEDLIYTVVNSELYGSEHFDQNVLKQYTQDFLEEKHNNGRGVWHIYAWQKWAANFVVK